MSEESNELRRGALAVLQLTDPGEKCAAVRALALAHLAVDTHAQLPAPQGIPGRPQRPRLVRPQGVPRRAVSSPQGRAAMLHAVAHIEFNAIGLALDAVWRFAQLPEAYYRDWTRVAVEEVEHFCLLRERLRSMGHDYGDFDAHDGLWEMTRKTTHDVLERMAMVPRTLEARGLDASPQLRAKLAQAGDDASAQVIDIILRDEIGHVAIGNHWFAWLCKHRGLDPRATFVHLSAVHAAPRLRGAINVQARLAAGFDRDELAQLGATLDGPADVEACDE